MRHWSRRWVTAALAVALAVPLGACSSTGPTSPVEAVALLDSAIGDSDRGRFDEALDGSVPQAERDLWWANLSRLENVGVSADGDGWQVSWSLPGEKATATEALEIDTGCSGSRCRVTGIRASTGRPGPLWLAEEVSVSSHDGALVLLGQGARDPGEAAEVAAGAAASSGMELLSSRASDPLVLEVPATDGSYALVTGRPAASTRGLGALTQMEGGAARIVLNPSLAGQWSTEQLTMLLTHESVHWRLSDLGAPVAGNEWVSEGLAEWLALLHDPDELASSRQLAVQACQDASGAPALPADAEFSATDDADSLRGVYARSWAAVSELVDESGPGPAGAGLEQLWTNPASQQPGTTDVLSRWCATNAS